MKPRRDWKQFLKDLERTDDYGDRDWEMSADSFGGNVFHDNSDAAAFFRRLEKAGGKVEILDYENINLYLPKAAKKREKIYMELLLRGGHTDIRYKAKLDALEICWS